MENAGRKVLFSTGIFGCKAGISKTIKILLLISQNYGSDFVKLIIFVVIRNEIKLIYNLL